MTEKKFTPGPWVLSDWVHEDEEGNKAGRFLGNDDGEVVGYLDVGELEANARLIAAAPELLETLEKLQRGPECWCEMAVGNPMVRNHSLACVWAKAAIAKAYGANPGSEPS